MANRYPLILNAAAGQLQELPTGDSLDLGGESILGVGNLTVGGDFTVSGTTTNINTVNLLVEDKNIVIGDVASPTNTTADGGGVTLKGAVDKTIAWLNATAAWTFSEHISIASAKEYRIAGTKVLDATSLGSAVVSSSLTSVGTIATGVWNGSVIGKAYLDATVVSTGDTGTVTSTMILNDTILDADINASAGIVDTKLATIATAGKVSNSATTATNANTALAIVARDENNNFVAGTITAALTGAASSNVLKAGDTMTGALVVPLGAFGTPSLTFTGDLDTGIYSPGADQLAVATNGTGRLFVDSAGIVGIGDNLLGSKPTNVNRVAYVGGSYSDTNIPGLGFALYRGGVGEHGHLFWSGQSTGGNPRIIGSIRMEQTIATTPNGGGDLIFNTNPGTAEQPTERLRITSTGTLNFKGAGTAGSTQAVSFNGSAPVDSMVLDSSGRLGIGTSSPGVKIDIVSDNNTSLASVLRVNSNNVAVNTSLAYDGLIGSGQLTVQAGASQALILGSSATEKARIDSSGRLLVGTSTSRSTYNAGDAPKFQVESTTAGATVGITLSIDNTNSSELYLAKTRGSAVNSHTIVQNNDNLGILFFNGADGTNIIRGASVGAQVDGTPGANDMPGRLVFSTTADGASTPTERMRINSAGALGVGGANFGTTGQALISNGSSAVPTWQDLNTAVFGWDHDNDTYGLYLPGTSISTGSLSGTINIDVQSRIRRCVINDSGVVQYYLDADASTNKSADWLRIVETESLATAYTGAPAAEATNSLLRVGVPAWAAGTFTRGQRVTNGGYLWECVAASSTATPAAGAVASVLDGTDGQVVVEIPAFSVRYGFINGVHTREVRLGCNDGLIAQGFRPHPAFIKTDGTYKSAFYWGAYQAYSDGTNLASVSGQTNTRSLTRATFRTRAALRGTGWHVQSYLELAAIQTLLVTEYRDYNSQKVLGNGSSEGATYGVSTGLSDSRGNRSGNVYTGGGSSSDFMSYRGIENLYGRAWTWADGINVYERVVYLTNNQSVFADDTSVGYSFYAQVPSGSGSYQKELFPLADVFLPSVVTGASSTTYLADGLWTGSGWHVAFVGGLSGAGSLVGAFGLFLFSVSGNTGVSIGARSAYAAN